MGSMNSKLLEKNKAIELRRDGKTYNEILKEVNVSKSTLSLWLRSVFLSKPQDQKLTDKKLASQKRGGEKRREIRIKETDQINIQCSKDITNINYRELFLIGIALYWAEGAKKTKDKVGTMIDFANSDPEMVKLFIQWLLVIVKVKKEDIRIRLHIHDLYSEREFQIKEYWSNTINVPLDNFTSTNFKKHNPKTKRSNVGKDYVGLVSVRVKRSTQLNRRILGWIYAIIATQKV